MNEMLDQKIRYRNAVARAHQQVIRGQSSMIMVKEAPDYTGRARELLPIVLGNLVLTFLTVGIYRFWAKTRLRRYFVSRVSFLSDPLEYNGTGMELFIGFLIVLAILVPFLIVTGMIQQFVAAPGADPMAAGIFQAGYLLAFYFLYNVAVYRAQRYRLSRTSWRGIRGGQQGSALLYAVYAMGLGLVTLFTAGLLYPVMRRVLVGYRINNACFGKETLQFSGGTAVLFGVWLVPWLLVAAVWATAVYAVMEMGLATRVSGDAPIDLAKAVPIWEKYKLILLPALALVPIAFIWYRTVELRQWFKNTRFEQLEFTSRLNLFHILLPYFVYLTLLAAVIGAVFYGLAQAFGTMGPGSVAGLPVNIAIVMGMAGFAAVWLFASLLQPLIVQNWLLNNICRTLTVQGRFSPDTLFQNQLDIPRSGEGLADALDVDAF